MALSVTGQGDTDPMTSRLLWLIRFTGFVVVGLLALIDPPGQGPDQLLDRAIQIACFSMVGLALATWLLVGEFPRHRPRGLPIALCAMAAASGLAAVTDGGGQSLVAFAAMAAVAAGAELDPPAGLPAALAVVAAGILPILIAGPIVGSTLGTLAGYPLLILACFSLGRNRRSYRVQAEQSAALLEQYQRLRAEQRRADVLDERTRIAREIHDVLAHSLGALGIQIQAAKAMLTDHQDIDRAVEALSVAQRMAADGLTETRRAVHALRLDTLPLAAELDGVVNTHRQRYQVAVTFETSGAGRPLPPDASLALLRTAQEALVNAAKHAPGEDIDVRLDYGERDVRLTIVNHLNRTDAAAAPGPSSAGGYGLTGMAERLRLLNGTLQAGPRGAGPRSGEWAVTAVLPLASEGMAADSLPPSSSHLSAADASPEATAR
jgi:signal transduction histidine kinase